LIYVKVYKNNYEKAISKFKKKIKESKLLVALRKKEYYTKKSTKRKEKKAKARLRQKNHIEN